MDTNIVHKNSRDMHKIQTVCIKWSQEWDSNQVAKPNFMKYPGSFDPRQ